MHFEGKFDIAAPPQKVFDFLLDPKKFAKCLPDLQKLEVKGKDRFSAVVKVGVGFIKGAFTFDFTVVERTRPSHARLKAHGSGTGSSVDLDSTMDLAEEPAGGTAMSWKADAQVGGLLAGVGQRLLQGVAEKTVNQLFASIRKELEKK